jgi:hypothetical protein
VPAQRVILLPTSEKQPQTWQYITEAPPDGWTAMEFDDKGWRMGFGGFGTEATPGARVRTEWKENDIWLRRGFELDDVPAGELFLRVHHDEDAEVFLNGVKVRELRAYSTSYRDVLLGPEAAAALRPGANVLAVHCRQTAGGQYIDAGLVVLRAKQPE